MSEDSDYYSNSDNESENSDNELNTENTKPLFKPSVNIKPFEENNSDEDELDDADDDEEEENIVEDVEEDLEEPIEKFSEDEDNDEDVDDDDEDDDIEEVNEIVEGSKVQSKSQKVKKTQLDIDDDDDDDEYDESYLQKFDSEISKNYIEEFHPECLNHNYDEISKLSIVIRNSDGIIIDPLHRTIPVLTKYEKARILGQRAKQIETGSRPYVKVPENIIDGYIIAELELREKKIPFIIKRPIPGGAFEYWNLKDLENISF